ncbi:hypothetical protein GCK72_023038 [Caenorhabditis remanei]|uniref:Protein kinase domain-containing protein n=1 Tax=Caenorhabditis remanei TaxID=31234 RepID=A0A6A5FVX0_CAERE|nr:hypothetical protein GCK72_023038 [Caenorhabditis remanei]KAF1746581.1 hypothetical protein GCK72_023038 [Caenorhabditis remanei]
MDHSLSYRKVNALSLPPGTLINEHYEVKKLMCRTRLTEVYEVCDKRGDAKCVLKVLDINNGSFLVESNWLEKRRRDRGFPYLVEAFKSEINGEKYNCIVTSHESENWIELQKRNGNISIANTLRIGYKLFCMLDDMHQKGFVHRDIQFSNILFDLNYGGDIDIKLIDFEHTVQHTPAPESIRLAGWYRSLEVIEGKPFTVFDDYTSLVCLLMHCQNIKPFGNSWDTNLQLKRQFNNTPMAYFPEPKTEWIGRLYEEIKNQRTAGYDKSAIIEIFKNALAGVSPQSPISYTFTNGLFYID